MSRNHSNAKADEAKFFWSVDGGDNSLTLIGTTIHFPVTAVDLTGKNNLLRKSFRNPLCNKLIRFKMRNCFLGFYVYCNTCEMKKDTTFKTEKNLKN